MFPKGSTVWYEDRATGIPKECIVIMSEHAWVKTCNVNYHLRSKDYKGAKKHNICTKDHSVHRTYNSCRSSCIDNSIDTIAKCTEEVKATTRLLKLLRKSLNTLRSEADG